MIVLRAAGGEPAVSRPEPRAKARGVCNGFEKANTDSRSAEFDHHKYANMKCIECAGGVKSKWQELQVLIYPRKNAWNMA